MRQCAILQKRDISFISGPRKIKWLWQYGLQLLHWHKSYNKQSRNEGKLIFQKVANGFQYPVHKTSREKKSIFNGVIFPVAADFRDNASQVFGWPRQPNSQLWFQVKQFLVLICSWSACLAYELLPSDLVIKWPSYLLLLHIKLSICWKWSSLCCLAWKKCMIESKNWQRTFLMIQNGPN